MLSRLYKLIFDLGVYFSVGAFLLYFFGGETLQAGGFLIIVVSAALTLFLRYKGRQSLLPVLLLPVIGGVFLRPSVRELLVYLPGWSYVIYLLTSDRLLVGRGEVLDRVRGVLIIFLLAPLFMLVELNKFGDALHAAVPFLVVLVVSIVLLLRHLRTRLWREGQKGYHVQLVGEMVIFLSVCVLLTLTRTPQNLFLGLQFLYRGIILPLLSLLGTLVGMLLGRIITFLLSLLNLESLAGRSSSGEEESYGRLKDIPELERFAASDNPWLLPLLYSLGILIGVGLLFIFLRRLMGDKSRQGLPAGVSELRETLIDTSDKVKRQKLKHSKEPADRIRYYYMKYLLHLNSRKVVIRPVDTTREVDHKFTETLPESFIEQREASGRLKGLYRRARYQKQHCVSQEDADLAKKLYRRIKVKKE